MSLPTAASDHYRTQQRLVVATLALTRSAWAQMDFNNVDSSWERVAPKLFGIVSAAQLGAARNGVRFVPEALAEQGADVKPLGLVRAQAFAGVASNGGSLMDLLATAPIRVKQAQSLGAGGSWVDMVAHTSVQDAARNATGVGVAVTPRVSFVRVVNPPCCQRCAVLAGKYSAMTAFARHPRCDCFAAPVADGQSFPGQEVEPGDIKDLTIAQRKAIADGADMNQVINSHRAGARSKSGMTTTEGTTRRGIASKRIRADAEAEGRTAGETVTALGRRGFVKNSTERRVQRLTPEGIYRIASDRDEAVRLLRSHGYVL